MFSQFKPFFMANIPTKLNNSPSSIASTIFLSEKDLSAAALINSMDCNFLRETTVVSSRPSLEFPETCQMVTSSSSSRNLESEHHEGDNNGKVFEKHQEEENRYEVLVSSLKVKLTNTTVNKEKEEEEEQGCKTPTSPEYKIPAACPPAPRKPKAVPAKRRGCCHKRVFLDLSDETESLFPPLLLADLGKKIKKIRSS
ncbi:cyclin-dependent protein kinase inhibitor SMR14-like [Ipomoea triloba]|uniref:cyclin-dependent protein kinase inhibitor SMR14-like n=1 Tax=Ipomoea triloba TaxID=35885 RepID=UPI00125DBC2E|nr:cyclin-dependent protein kinase inhibitor SMR14-like [Ipomoea triloba]